MSESKLVYINVEDLRPNQINPALYRDEKEREYQMDEALELGNGDIEPLIITKDNVIISGHRRWRAAKRRGVHNIPCIIKDVKDKELAHVLYNVHRRKNIGEIIGEIKILLPMLEARAASAKKRGRKKGGLIRHGQLEADSDPKQHSQKVAKQLSNIMGVSEDTVKKILSLMRNRHDLLDRVQRDEVSVNRAYSEMKVDDAGDLKKQNKIISEEPENRRDSASVPERKTSIHTTAVFDKPKDSPGEIKARAEELASTIDQITGVILSFMPYREHLQEQIFEKAQALRGILEQFLDMQQTVKNNEIEAHSGGRPNEDEDNGKISSNDGKPDPIPANEHSHAEGGKVRQDSEARGSVCDRRSTYSNINRKPQVGDIIKGLPCQTRYVVDRILDGGIIECFPESAVNYVRKGKLVLRGGIENQESKMFKISSAMRIGRKPGEVEYTKN
ncbi:MAG: ParB N-terminal domain-containing protein [Deltaproteobacteria bacterium]|nr:ParB N-terminal domain-containing protein [Deltaproteobacteria bacterium]